MNDESVTTGGWRLQTCAPPAVTYNEAVAHTFIHMCSVAVVVLL